MFTLQEGSQIHTSSLCNRLYILYIMEWYDNLNSSKQGPNSTQVFRNIIISNYTTLIITKYSVTSM